jgi:hypothetical protein
MPEQRDLASLVARLNEAADVLSALRSGQLGALLGRRSGVNAGCDYHCTCNDSFCRCNGAVKSSGMDTVTFPEFLAMREARLAELRREIEALRIPADLGGTGS